MEGVQQAFVQKINLPWLSKQSYWLSLYTDLGCSTNFLNYNYKSLDLYFFNYFTQLLS